jgi:hypothetical protein
VPKFVREAVSLELDAAGVKIIPIHGTRNLQGLVSAELAITLGIKMGVLTDQTNPAAMGERSNKKRFRWWACTRAAR